MRLYWLPTGVLALPSAVALMAALYGTVLLREGATMAGASSRADLSQARGWSRIPDTKMQSVCPSDNFNNSDYPFAAKCKNVVDAWGGAVADTVGNRLILWGGGHSDYSGNEIYDLNLNTRKVERLSDPAVPVAVVCSESLTGPTPNSRHTYDGLAFVPELNAMLSFAGSLAPTGCASTEAWKLDMKKLSWDELRPSGTAPVFNGGVAAVSYDPNRKGVFISTGSYGSFAYYDYTANSYKLLNRSATTEGHQTSVIDTKRRLFFLFGGGYAQKVDISGKDISYSLKTIKANGCNFKNSVYPGVAFDTGKERIVGWDGGGSVYVYNPERDSCSSENFSNGPGAQQPNGTNKRFSYFPGLNAFVLVNSFSEDAYLLRLTGNAGVEQSREKAETQGSSSARISSPDHQTQTPPQTTVPDTPATSAQEAPNPANAARLEPSLNTREADRDFAARCSAEGVIKCVGWDSPADFIPAFGGGGYADGLYAGDDRAIHGTMDKDVKTSGAGSLMFTIGPNATPNATGYWRANFGRLGHLTAFGPHTTLYFQFRLRLDENMLKFKWTRVSNEGWKVFIAYGPIPGPSCTGAQFVQENTYQRNVATAYTSCGTPSLSTNNGVPPYFLEQGDYNCAYDSSAAYTSNHNCFAYPANTWITEYWVVEIGDFGQPNTHFTAYIAAQGKPLKRFIDLPKFRFNNDPQPNDALETMLLQPYMSGANGTKANPIAHMWFDELIISTKPIAAPKY